MLPGWEILKNRRDAATECLKRTVDPVERNFVGSDVRELEKLVEIALSKAFPEPFTVVSSE